MFQQQACSLGREAVGVRYSKRPGLNIQALPACPDWFAQVMAAPRLMAGHCDLVSLASHTGVALNAKAESGSRLSPFSVIEQHCGTLDGRNYWLSNFTLVARENFHKVRLSVRNMRDFKAKRSI